MSKHAGGPLCAAALLLLARRVEAGGFSIFDQGARGMGFGGAYSAQAADPSAVFYNPAGLAFLRNSKQLLTVSTLKYQMTQFRGTSPAPGPGVHENTSRQLLIPPAAYYCDRLTSHLSLAVGVFTPFGITTSWSDPDHFSGRFISQSFLLRGFAASPAVAWRFSHHFSAGATLDVRFSSLALDRSLPLVDPNTGVVSDAGQAKLKSDTKANVGFALGILAKPTRLLSIGMAYHHGVSAHYKGKAALTLKQQGDQALDALARQQFGEGSIPFKTTVAFPAFAAVGVAYDPKDWTIEADTVWYQWSRFDHIAFEFPTSSLNQTIPAHYHDSYQLRMGAEKRFNTWTLRAGYFLDPRPGPPSSVSPTLPTSTHHGLSGGFAWRPAVLTRWSSAFMTFDITGRYVIAKDSSTMQGSSLHYDGTYSGRVYEFSSSLGYTF